MKITVKVDTIIQDSQEVGSDDEHMVSRVFFSVTGPDGSVHTGAHADIKQTVGAAWDSPLEVSKPTGYQGPLNHQAFADQVSRIFKTRCVFIEGRPAGSIRMMDNTFSGLGETFDLDVSGSAGTW